MPQFFRSGPCILRSANHALDNEEYVEKGNDLLSWKMPRVHTSKIYRRSNRFSLFSNRSIKTKEGKVSLGNGSAAIRLITENPFMNGVSKDKRFYTMFNVGLIQIGVKTLTTKIPRNASMILCVCDNRRDKFEDSFLGMVEAKLSDGPFYFNVFPNITMSVFHPKLCDALTLNVIVEGCEKLPAGSKPISVMYRTYYKLQNTSEPDALIESPDGKTVFFQTDVEGSDVNIQKVSNWDDVVGKLVSSLVEEKNQT